MTFKKQFKKRFFNLYNFFLGGQGVSFKVFDFPSFQVSKFLRFQVSKWEGGPMRGLGTDYVISGPMRGPECI